MATLGPVLSDIGSGTFAVKTGYGGNIYDTAFITVLFILSLAFSFSTFADFGFTVYQALAGYTLRWKQMMAAYTIAYREKQGVIKEELENVQEYLKSFLLGNWVGMSDMADYKKFEDLGFPGRQKLKGRFANAWAATSIIQALFTFALRCAFTIAVFLTIYGGIYGEPDRVGPGSRVQGWYIALIVFVLATMFFHKVATLFVFNAWNLLHWVGVAIDGLCIIGSALIVLCAGFLSSTGSTLFIGVAIMGGVLVVGFIVIVLWEIFLAAPVIYFMQRTYKLVSLVEERSATK